MSADPELIAARARAEEARQRLLASTHRLQARVAPSRLANDAIENAKERGAAAIDEATRVAKAKPAAVAGGVALVLAFLARRRIARLFRRRRKPKQITIPATPKRALPGPKGDRS